MSVRMRLSIAERTQNTPNFGGDWRRGFGPWASSRRQLSEARVPSPVRERSAFAESRVRDENVPDMARRLRASMACSILKVLVPHPNPLPHGRGGLSRSVIEAGGRRGCVTIVTRKGEGKGVPLQSTVGATDA